MKSNKKKFFYSTGLLGLTAIILLLPFLAFADHNAPCRTCRDGCNERADEAVRSCELLTEPHQTACKSLAELQRNNCLDGCCALWECDGEGGFGGGGWDWGHCWYCNGTGCSYCHEFN